MGTSWLNFARMLKARRSPYVHRSYSQPTEHEYKYLLNGEVLADETDAIGQIWDQRQYLRSYIHVPLSALPTLLDDPRNVLTNDEDFRAQNGLDDWSWDWLRFDGIWGNKGREGCVFGRGEKFRDICRLNEGPESPLKQSMNY